MLVDLGTVRELLRRHEVKLFEKRYVAVGFVVALDTGISIPVPDTAEVAAEFDDPNIVDARLLQVGRRQQAREAATENRDVDVLDDRGAGCHRRVRIGFVVAGEVVLQFDVLLGTFLAQPLFALLSVFLAQRWNIDIVWGLRRLAIVLVHRHAGGCSCSESSRGPPAPMYFDN